MPRKSENRVKLTVRVDAQTPARLAAIAIQLGFVYDGGAAVGQLLDAIAKLAEKLSPDDLTE